MIYHNEINIQNSPVFRAEDVVVFDKYSPNLGYHQISHQMTFNLWQF